MLNLKKISNKNAIKAIKIIQLLLVIISLILLMREEKYLAVWPLIFAFMFELFVPRKYGWGSSSKENLFFKNISVLLENTILFLVLMILSIVVISFF